ncbi:MAG: sensor histidine kinase [Candidatus Limnocylindria bacterium]
MPSDPESGGRRHRGWGGGRGGSWSSQRPRWWPEGEPWPPHDEEARRRLRRRFARRAGCALAIAVAVAILAVAGLVWLLTSALGPNGLSAVLGVILILVLAGVVGRGLRAVRLAIAPLGDLIEASARIEAGELGATVRESGPREARALARAFNSMSSRLAANTEDQRRLLADVSHELRTPLTVIQGNVEGMIDGLYPPDRPNLERVLAETRRLERLVEALRTVSLADAGALALRREAVDLPALAADVVAGFEPQAATAGVTLAVDAADVASLELDPLRVRQVVGNLVSNALHHTLAGGRVVVGIHPADDGVELSVTDTGSGMDAPSVERAFDRFWRSGESAGAGLGLGIVRDLVRAHGGEVELESSPGAGTVVRCRFPGASAPDR